MTTRTYRILVSGQFNNLTGEQRRHLRNELNGLPAGFSANGTLSSDSALRFFTFRYELEVTNDNPQDSDVEAPMMAEEMAHASLRERGLGYRNLKVTGTTCLDDMRIRAPKSRRRA